jgi:glycine cleavage system aminomethyltransferase T
MKNTALTQKHQDLGAKLVPFAGYNMPVQYEGVTVEHETVRNGVGVFDVSHMGEFDLKGEFANFFADFHTAKAETMHVYISIYTNAEGTVYANHMAPH